MATQITIDQARSAGFSDSAHASAFKSILVHVQDEDSLEQRLEAALSLARPTSAHLSCIHVTPAEAYVASDRFGGLFVMENVMEAIDEQIADVRKRVEVKLGREDVSWDYEELTGDLSTAIISRAALSDLVMIGRTPRRQDFVGATSQLLGYLLGHCRSPLFIPGDDGAVADPTTVAAIAWDGSYEAANAVRSSIGMLRLAEAVTVIQVAEQKNERYPRTKMLEYLSRHGIHAELIVQSRSEGYAENEEVTAALISATQQVRAAYLVTGAYSHSRIGELLFGGVTRSLLHWCPFGLVIAH